MKVDITSTTLEKGFDLAKNFLDKIVGPPLEEIGLFLKEKVTFWRFKNQLTVVNKAREYCITHNISPREISLKILAPLMENASLEEDETLQDKWATLLGNMADSEQNIQNHVFPYLLSQISKNEFKVLEATWNSKRQRIANLNKELIGALNNERIKQVELSIQLENLNSNEDAYRSQELEAELNGLKYDVQKLNYNIQKEQVLSNITIEEFELANLTRLGTIKSIPINHVYAEPITIPAVLEFSHERRVDIKVGIEPDGDYHILTELGELFIKACSEKNKT